MSLRARLRLIDYNNSFMETLKNHFAGSEIIVPNGAQRFLQLTLLNEQGRVAHTFIDVDIWLQSIESDFSGIPWLQVPLVYIVQLMKSGNLRFLLDDVVWEAQDIYIPVEPIPRKLLKVWAKPCALFCVDWPTLNAVTQKNKTLQSFGLPFELRFVLGASQLTLSEVINLSVGDLILIKQRHYSLIVGDVSLFNFSYQHNQVVVVESSYNEEHDFIKNDDEVLFDWTTLPVNVEFVLDSVTLPLSELNEISPGKILPVSADAEQKIKIYINRKLLAFGELVALENGDLAIDVKRLSHNSYEEKGQKKC